jgi:hypothetical protein
MIQHYDIRSPYPKELMASTVDTETVTVTLTRSESVFLRYLVTLAGEKPHLFGGESVRLDTGAKMRYLAMVDRLRRKLQ